jgi:hypothetical protein
MSAFLCDEKIFDNIASTLAHYAEYKPYWASRTAHCANFITKLTVKNEDGTIKLHPTLREQTEVFARRLYELNLEAICQRYTDGSGDDYGYKFTQRPPVQNKTALYKSLGCLIYQCSEGNVPEMDLFKRLEQIYDAMAHDIVSSTKEYDVAAWG